nr:hypothetical protein [Tanacetum cinerariifolium]
MFPSTPRLGVCQIGIQSQGYREPGRILEVDPSKSSLPPVSVAPMVSPFLCLDDSESDTEMPERHVSPIPHDAMLNRLRRSVASRSSSPTTSTPEIPTTPILPVPCSVVAPSPDIISPEDIPIGRLYRTYPGGPCRALTVRNSVRPLPFHHLALRFSLLSTMYPLTTSESSAGNSFSESSARTSRKRCRSPDTTVTSSIHAPRALVPSRDDLLPPRERFKDSISPEDIVEEDIDINVLADIKADATAVEVVVDRDVEVGVDACISMEVNVMVDVEDEDELLIEVEEVVQDIYGHVMEIPIQRVEDIETGQRELEERSLINNDLAAYTQRFQELTMICTKMVPEEEESRVEKFIGGLFDNIQGNVITIEPIRLHDVVRIANNLMDQKLKGYAKKNVENKRRDYMNLFAATTTQRSLVVNQRVPTCFECGRQEHYRNKCPKLKNQTRRNEARKKTDEARGKAYVLGEGEANPDSNVVMDVSYAVELADGRVAKTNTMLRGCTLGLLGHPFNIDLMPVELGSFDIIVSMDWLRTIMCMSLVWISTVRTARVVYSAARTF